MLVHVKRIELQLDMNEYAIMKEAKFLFNMTRECLKVLQSESEACVSMVIPFHIKIISA